MIVGPGLWPVLRPRWTSVSPTSPIVSTNNKLFDLYYPTLLVHGGGASVLRLLFPYGTWQLPIGYDI